jgi:hypothetical protein
MTQVVESLINQLNAKLADALRNLRASNAEPTILLDQQIEFYKREYEAALSRKGFSPLTLVAWGGYVASLQARNALEEK